MVASLGLAFGFASSARAASKSAPILAEALCWGGEQPVFACSMAKSTKSVAYCLKGEHLTYRFGTPMKTELSYPADDVPAAKAFQRRHEPDTAEGGAKQLLGFARGKTRYLLTQSGDAAQGKVELTVDLGEKRVTTLDCDPAQISAHWELLEPISMELLPRPAGSAGPAPAVAPGPANKKNDPVVCAEKSKLSGYFEKVTLAFRKQVETTDELYKFATKTFGPLQSCSVVASFVDGLDIPDEVDASAFMGVMRFNFAGASIVFSNPGTLDSTLVAPSGFPDEAKARAALEKAAGFPLKKAKKLDADEESAAQRFKDLWDADWDRAPYIEGAGAPLVTTVLQEPDGDEGEQAASATLTYRAKRLVAIRVHQ